MFFSPDPKILLGKTPLKVVIKAKFLGLIFDTKLTFKNHVQYLKSSHQKALDILGVVGHTDWGDDRIVRVLVCSKLDNGCTAYRLAHRSILKQLDLIHHQGLHIALGAFDTSLAQSLYLEAYEPSLASRHLKLSLNYVLKLKSLPENPAYSCIFEPEMVKLFQESVSKIPPLGINILPHLEKSEINLNPIDDASFVDIAPWTLSIPIDLLMITYIALFSALLSRLTVLTCGSAWVTSFIAFFFFLNNIHRSGVLTALVWLVSHETAAISAQVLCTPYNHAPCHFMQSHIRKVYVCLAVTCHLHFWQNDQNLLHATAVTLGWNGYQNKSQHRKSTLEKKILPPLLQDSNPQPFSH